MRKLIKKINIDTLISIYSSYNSLLLCVFSLRRTERASHRHTTISITLVFCVLCVSVIILRVKSAEMPNETVKLHPDHIYRRDAGVSDGVDCLAKFRNWISCSCGARWPEASLFTNATFNGICTSERFLLLSLSLFLLDYHFKWTHFENCIMFVTNVLLYTYAHWGTEAFVLSICNIYQWRINQWQAETMLEVSINPHGRLQHRK